MSDYERKAYHALTAAPEDSRSIVPRWARDSGAQIGESVRSGLSKMPGNEVIAEAYATAAKGLIDFTSGNGIQSVSLSRSMKRHQKAGHAVERTEDFIRLDLRECDAMIPSRKQLHQVAALVEGAASSLLITGATVSTTVSGGATAAVVVATLTADSVIMLAGIGRIVGEVAVAYGYDPRLPEEEVFAAQVIGLGFAVGGGAKTAALTSLSRLTQDMMRRATWTQLNQHLLVEVINQAFATLGLKLTQKKLGQLVPVAGILISSGVNLQLVRRMHAAASQAYRLRFLTEKYALVGPSTEIVPVGSEVTGDEGVLDVGTMLAEAVLESRLDNGRSAERGDGDSHRDEAAT